jgi:hypothetical protein
MKRKMIAIVALFLLGFLIFGCLNAPQIENKTHEEEITTDTITQGITVEDVTIPEINESEGNFSLPV